MSRSSPPSRGERWALLVLVMLGLAHAVAYALLVPPWQAPDEPGHFEHVRLVADGRGLTDVLEPDPDLEREIMASLYANRYWEFVPHGMPEALPERLADLETFAGRSRTLGRPSLSYLPYVVAIWPLRHQDVDLQLLVLRLVSASLLPLVVYLGWRTGRVLFPDDIGPALVAGALLALLPQHAHVMASVSDGNLTEVLASAYFLVLAVAARRGLTLRHALALGVLALLALLGKNTALFLLPLTVVAVPVLGLRRRVRGWAWAVAAGGALALPALGARFAPRNAHLQSLLNRWDVVIAPESYAPDRLANYYRWTIMTFESFWGRFGWMNVRMEGIVYALAAVAAVAALVGLVVRLALPSCRRRLRPGVGRCLALFGIAAAFSLAFVLGTFVVYYSPYGNFSQGRYLFPALVPLAVLGGYGAGSSSSLESGRTPVMLVLAGLLLLSVYALFGTVASTFLWES